MTSAFFCSECGYENVVAGCGFCLQCGAEFNLNEHQAAAATEASPPPAELALPAQPAPVEAQVQPNVSVPVPAAAPAPVVANVAAVAAAPSPVQPPQNPDLVQLSAHPDSIAMSRGGTIDFQTAIATAEQCDFENGRTWDEVDPHAVGSVEVHPPSQDDFAGADVEVEPQVEQSIAVEQAAAVPHIQVPPGQQPGIQPVPVAPVSPPAAPVSQDEFSEVLDHGGAPVAVAAVPPAAVAPATPAQDPAEDADADVETEEETFAGRLEQEMTAAVISAAGLVNMKVREDGDRLVAQLLIDGRPQLVFIERNLSAQHPPILSMYAVCGPASAENAMPLLEWNRALNMCAFAVREVGEKKMFVIQSNVLAYGVDQALMSKTLFEIAKRANQVNERLIG